MKILTLSWDLVNFIVVILVYILNLIFIYVHSFYGHKN